MKKLFEYETKSGRTITKNLPTKNVVCATCGGKGKHVNRAIDGHGLTQEDFDSDPDFAENYFSGWYDVNCEECQGNRVTQEVDENILTHSQRRFWQSICRVLREIHREDAAERWGGYQF